MKMKNAFCWLAVLVVFIFAMNLDLNPVLTPEIPKPAKTFTKYPWAETFDYQATGHIAECTGRSLVIVTSGFIFREFRIVQNIGVFEQDILFCMNYDILVTLSLELTRLPDGQLITKIKKVDPNTIFRGQPLDSIYSRINSFI